MTICSLGVYGTVYERYSPVTVYAEVHYMSSKTIMIENVHSRYTIGNELDIMLR